ncbi:MAG: hypothetical protein ACE5LA_05335, partial [Dehalococcoidales bacterium]
MKWFGKHINWTYLLCLVGALVVAFVIYSAVLPEVDTSDPLYGLRVYLDEDYETEWRGANIPDLNTLVWRPSEQEGWEEAVLMVYLENEGEVALDVEFAETENPRYAIPGFSVSSATVRVDPGERTPAAITIEESPSVLAVAGSAETIYWLVTPVAPGEGALDIMVMVVVSAIMLGTAAWLLHRKGRSYAWLLLSLSGIGVIV